MATFNGREWTVADMLPFKYVENWDAFFDDVIAEMSARRNDLGASLVATSSTDSVAIGTGTKTLTVASPSTKGFSAGMYVVAADASNNANAITGRVTSYDTTTGALVISVPTGGTAGSGTPSSWTIGISGAVGPAGANGTNGATGPITTHWGGTAGGTANALTATTGASLTSLTAGQIVGVKVGASANSGAATLNVDGIGDTAVRKNGSALVGGELAASTDLWFQYDGTYFRLLGGSGSGTASYPTLAKSGAYAVTTSDAGKLIVATGTWTLSLLAAATAGNGFTLAVSNSGSGIITVKPNGAETIGSVGAVAIGAGGSLIIICDGTSWHLIGAVSSLTTLDSSNKGASITLSNNNLTATNSTATWSCVRANTAITAGKWYIEFRQDVTDASPTKTMVGVASSSVSMVDSNHIGVANCWSLSDAGLLAVSGSNTSGWSSAWGAVGSVVGLYIDATNLASIKIWFALNGVLIASGDPTTGANPAATITGSPTLYPAVALIGSQQATVKFSKSSWQYTPVTGYNALP